MKAITWFKKHLARQDTIRWIEKNNIQTMEEFWDKCERSDWMIQVMEIKNIGSNYAYSPAGVLDRYGIY